MKKLLFAFVLSFSVITHAQTELKFDTSFFDAENSYVALPKKDQETKYIFGVPYYDDVAGYSFKYYGDFKIVEGNFVKEDSYTNQSGSMIVRWENLGLKVAVLSQNVTKQFGLPVVPDFLKYYASKLPAKELLVNKLSSANGAGASNIALPKLETLYNEKYDSQKLFFELTFAYNALGKFAEAEKISNDVLKRGKADDLIKKEYIYSLVNQNKVKEADDFLSKNISSFKTQNNKIEALINTIALSAHNGNLTVAEKWMKELKSEPNIDRYQKNIQQLESIIKEKQSKIL